MNMTKTITISRKLLKNGCVTIPKEIRDMLLNKEFIKLKVYLDAKFSKFGVELLQ